MNQIAISSKYFLLGILLYPILMNIAVFVSPIYSQLFYGEGTEHYQDLKHMAGVILPFFSVFYIVGAYHLAKLTGIVGKIILLSLSTTLVLSYIIKIIFPNEVILSLWSRLISIDYLLLAAALTIIFNHCRSSTKDNQVV